MLSLALKNIFRYRLRSSLTMAGVATGMFLFTTVETMQQSLARVTRSEADDTTLVVYRENRFCPSTSRLPEHYLSSIEKIEGVRKAIPIQIAVNNCGASLDVITFRGVPPENLLKYNPDLKIVEGSFENWTSRSDAALVGQTFAQRRELQTGPVLHFAHCGHEWVPWGQGHNHCTAGQIPCSRHTHPPRLRSCEGCVSIGGMPIAAHSQPHWLHCCE